jgi:hypothetical protein
MDDDAAAVSKAVLRGPRITLTCECGQREYLRYGESWTCGECGRTWNTNRIPAEQYAAIRATQLRYRRIPLIISTLALVCIVVFVILGKAFGGLIIVALLATTWGIFFRPMYQRRYREALADLPSWQIKPE